MTVLFFGVENLYTFVIPVSRLPSSEREFLLSLEMDHDAGATLLLVCVYLPISKAICNRLKLFCHVHKGYFYASFPFNSIRMYVLLMIFFPIMNFYL